MAPDGSVTGQLTIHAGSLNTKNKQRDRHLRSAGFFDVAFKGTFEAAGRSQQVSFTARAEHADTDAVTLRAELVVDRSSFGMTWSPLHMTAMEATGSVVARFNRVRTPSS